MSSVAAVLVEDVGLTLSMLQMSDTWSADVDSRYYVESVNATPFVYQEEVDYGLGCTFPFPVCVMCLIHS